MPIPPLPGTIQKAQAGLAGFDINQVLTGAQARGLKGAGYDFCLRYIPHQGSKPQGLLTRAEAMDILNAGLALSAVQRANSPGWLPSAALGTQDGNDAIDYAQNTLGLPAAMILWCDLEVVDEHAGSDVVLAYGQAWYTVVKAAGYIPGLYVGADINLTDQQLYNDFSFQHYWKAYNGQDVATRGFQIIQHTDIIVNHLTIGPDHTYVDAMGDSALWLSL